MVCPQSSVVKAPPTAPVKGMGYMPSLLNR